MRGITEFALAGSQGLIATREDIDGVTGQHRKWQDACHLNLSSAVLLGDGQSETVILATREQDVTAVVIGRCVWQSRPEVEGECVGAAGDRVCRKKAGRTQLAIPIEQAICAA